MIPNRSLRATFLVLALVPLAAPRLATAWVSPVVIAGAPAEQAEPEIVSDGAGGAIVFWRDYAPLDPMPGASTDFPVRARRVLAGGTADPAWPEHGAFVFEGGSMAGTSIVADGAGGAFIAFDSDSRRYVRVQHLRSDGTFDPAWPPGGRIVRDAGAVNRIEFVKLRSDGAGGVVVAWNETSPTWSIRAHRLDAAGTFHSAWPAGGRVVSEDVSGGFAMITDHDGGAVFTWRPASSANQALAHHVTANGALDSDWPAGGCVFGQVGIGTPVAAISDGAGGMLAFWWNYYEGASYAQHITAEGFVDAAWPAPGLIYGPGAPYAVAVEDGAGGFVSSWLHMSDPETNAYYVFGQHVLGTGSADPQWPASGLYVANTDSDSPADPRAVSDGAGGAIVAFEGYGYFALTRVLASGAVAPSWPSNGLRLSPRGSLIPALVPDGASGVIVAWTEWLGVPGSDIYVQRVGIASATTSVPHSVGTGPWITRVAPTPTRGACTIGFTMPAAGRVALAIHDVAGRKLCDLLRAEVGLGAHVVTWNGAADGRRVPDGVYFVSIATEFGSSMRRLVLVR